MILEKQVLPVNLGSPSFYREKDYSQVENIQESCQSSQEWTSQQVHPKVRLCDAQRNCKEKKEKELKTLQASASHVDYSRDFYTTSHIHLFT